MAAYEEFMALGLELPSAAEQVTWGDFDTPRVNGKMFAFAVSGAAYVTVKASPQDQAELIAAAPEAFGIAPSVGRFGRVRVTLARVDGAELAELPAEAWRRTAPKRLVEACDADRAAARDA
ncbi:MmcQ/YjbR family DNA-binding protein [Streptomyces sp. NPDC017179]|uniref:MmcQ/YjbR family DNA-binding protein n=1 Tax=Streptomyces sp. NPDC017179 TaxID=3364979 RepID=UPI00379397D4